VNYVPYRFNAPPIWAFLRGYFISSIPTKILHAFLIFLMRAACPAKLTFVVIINFYVCMYMYRPFSPHNGITIGNVLISFLSYVNANFNFSWNYYQFFVFI
jgi:hypothetical protein